MSFTKAFRAILLSIALHAQSSAQETNPPSEKPKSQPSPAEDAPSARDTTTGKDFEDLVRKSLQDLGYEVAEQVQVGTRPNGSKHMIDLVAKKDGKSTLISLKWQQSSGTAEQKVPYEMICLSEALKQSRGAHTAAYLVLGGEGWTLKEFYLSGGLKRHLKLDQAVDLLSVEDVLTRAEQNKL
jgi:pyruvate/2-oxoglutarate dehydrogenase complex dihydrolipoamide acyltransferase (E2) component